MGVDPTIVSLACQIAKLKQWGKAWERTAAAQLHAKGKEAWSDVPNATQWVEDMRGNTEASHDTPAGKEAAEAVVRDSQMTDTHDCGPNCPHCSW